MPVCECVYSAKSIITLPTVTSSSAIVNFTGTCESSEYKYVLFSIAEFVPFGTVVVPFSSNEPKFPIVSNASSISSNVTSSTSTSP